MRSTRPSSCLTVKTVPVSASTSEIFFSMMRSTLTRLNTSCSFCTTTRMMSPGASPGSEQPASPRSVTWRGWVCVWGGDGDDRRRLD